MQFTVIATKGGWVVPFGDRGIKGYLRLPHAFRSLSRPSSPPGAKASAMRPFLLSVDSASVPGLRPGGPYLRHASRTLVSLLLSLAIRLIYFNSVISMS